MRSIGLFVLLITAVCRGQAPSNPDELQHLRFILLNVASLDHSPEAVQAFENQLVKQFGLSRQESAAIHAAGQSLKPQLARNRQLARATVGGKNGLSQADVTALHNLDAQREQTISNLTTQILNSVRPATAARLRAAGNILAGKGKKNP